MAATFCNPSLGSRRLSFVKHNITHGHAVGDSSQLRPVAKRKVMEIRGVRHPKESSEAGTHVPPGVEVETLRQCEALASAAAGSCGWELRLQLPQTRARNTHNEEAKNENKLLSASLWRSIPGICRRSSNQAASTAHRQRTCEGCYKNTLREGGNARADGELDEERGRGVGGLAAVQANAAGNEPDDHERVANVMRIGAVAARGNA